MSTNRGDAPPPTVNDDAALAVAAQTETTYTLQQRADIDSQIATAKAFPRSLELFKKKLYSMATIDLETAEACTYALPRGKDKHGNEKTITGRSVRFAELVVASYGNLRTGCRVVHNNGKVVVAQGIVHDLEMNNLHTEEVERSILQWEYVNKQKTGRKIPMSEDMQVMAGRAGCKIAYRNAVFAIVPAALTQDVYEKVQDVARGTAETLPARREKRLNYFRTRGITDQQIFETIGVKGEADIDIDKCMILQGMITAHKNEESTLAELFPAPEAKDQAGKATAATEAKLKGNRKAADPAKSTQQQMEADMGGTPPQNDPV